MITVYRFSGKGVLEGAIDDLSKSKKCWADVVNPTRAELELISQKAHIPYADLMHSVDRNERPSVSDFAEYSSIIVRAPWHQNGNAKTIPLTIFISKNKNNVITIAMKELPSNVLIRNLVKNGKIDLQKESMSFLVYNLLDHMFDSYFAVLEVVEDNIDKIENMVIRNADTMTVESIISVKKTLIFFNKALTANREVIISVEKEYLNQIDKKNIKRFRALYSEVTQLIDMVNTYRDIMSGTLDIYMSSVSNSLNKVVKTLTIITAFIMVPTLIGSIYGMNFQTDSAYNMPELKWKYGYVFALALMVLSVFGTYLFFKWKKWV